MTSEQNVSSTSRSLVSTEVLLYALLFIAGLLLRWLLLEVKPIHHDESLHLMYGRYFFDFPEVNFYHYQAMLHGPLLYNALRLVYNTLGSSVWAGRALVAFLGTILMFSPLLFRRYFSKQALFLLTSAIALSPTLVYWSRFIREDNLQLTGLLISLVAVVLAPRGRKAMVFLIGLVLQFCEKENSYVTLALLLGYLVFEYWFTWAAKVGDTDREKDASPVAPLHKGALIALLVFALVAWGVGDWLYASRSHWNIYPQHGWYIDSREFAVLIWLLGAAAIGIALYQWTCANAEGTLIVKCARYLRRYWPEMLVGIAIAAFIYVYLYSAGFRYAKGVRDGIYRESLGYWMNQHNIERIPGPFLFHFYMLSWYELLFVVIWLYQMYLFYRRADLWVKIAGGAAAAIGLFFAITTYGQDSTKLWQYHWDILGRQIHPWKFFKLKDHLDVFALFIVLVNPFLVTVQHLLRKERALAFWGYFFTASLFTYSYLGEKVPWLSVYPFVPGLVYFALYLDQQFKRAPVTGYRNFPYSRILLLCGAALWCWGLIFLLQEGLGNSPAKPGSDGTLSQFLAALWAASPSTNTLFLLAGIALCFLGLLERRIRMFGSVNLLVLGSLFFCLFNLRSSILTNFTYSGDAREFISQVHTTKEFHEFVLKVRSEIEAPTRGFKPTVLGIEDSVWPITWYLIDLPQYKFSAGEEERKNFDYIFKNCQGNCPDKEFVEAPPPGFRSVKIPLRGWWVPEFKQMTLKKFLNYSINHVPWNDTGFSWLTVLVKEEQGPK